MRTLLQDLKFGWRVLTGHLGFTAAAVLTLALGIASATTVFSWIDSTLLRPVPGAARPAELAVVEGVIPAAPNGGTSISWLDYRDYRDRLRAVSGLALYRQATAFTLGDAENSRLAWGELVSPNYFDVLGITPKLGRFFARGELTDTPGAAPVVVVSHRLWRQYFQSDPKILGKVVRLNRQDLTVIGIAPPEFRGSSTVLTLDLWVPVTMGPQLGLLDNDTFQNRGARNFFVTARLRPGVSVEQADAEARTLAASLRAEYDRTNRGVGIAVLPPWRAHNGVADYLFAPLRILMAVSLIVLLIVCVNVANLLLARTLGRQREFGMRVALGASRARIARQMLTETLLLAAIGGFLAVPASLWMQSSLPSLVPSVGLPIEVDYALSGRILGFTAVMCVLAALGAGATPALFSFRTDINDSLKEGGRGSSASAGSQRTRGLLVVAEVALAVVALVGAGLFVRSFQNIRSLQVGFDARGVLFGRFFIESAAYSTEQIQDFTKRLHARLAATPGIESVSFSDFVPLSSTAGPYSSVGPEGYVRRPGEVTTVNRSSISPGYLALMRTPVLSGREFTEQDDRKTPPVMIVNQSFARRYFRGEDPVGRKVRMFNRDFQVVGLAADSRYFHPAERPLPFLYIPFRQFYGRSIELYCFVRTKADPEGMIPTLRRAVADVDHNASAFHAVPLAEYTKVTMIGQTIAAALMGALGLMCLLLAAIGLYSVMSYSVRQRAQEIGIRVAMGARPRDVIAMVVRQGMTLAGAGMVLGLIAALAATRLVSAMLVQVPAHDPVTFATAAGFLGGVALLATWVPAWRATRCDPVNALRRNG